MMTLSEFLYKRYAQEYKEIDKEYELHKLAFLIRNAEATENKGTDKKPKEEYVFKDFKDFFDYDQMIKSVDQEISENKKESPNQLSLAQVALEHNRRG
ncbi:hypothetical protein [Virgibacillus salexigens]|uniref:hypothetical protein n=1 Tax=Virgibacillus salexigens TaxID=61016 RepID=UPI00190A61B8|nr:hypothetical protein [Virgibacillus salexigens]